MTTRAFLPPKDGCPECFGDLAEKFNLGPGGIVFECESCGARTLVRPATDGSDSVHVQTWTREALGFVECDLHCETKLNPATLDEAQAAVEHWRRHPRSHGCSHGR